MFKSQNRRLDGNSLDLEKLNREDRNLFLFSVFLVLLLSLFILSLFLPSLLGDFQISNMNPQFLATILTGFGGIILIGCGYLYMANRQIGVLRQTLIDESSQIEGLKQRVEELTAILDVSRTLTGKGGARVVMNLLVERVRECLKADFVELMLVEGSSNQLVTFAASGEKEALKRVIEEGKGYEWWVIKNGEPFKYPDNQLALGDFEFNLPERACLLTVPLNLNEASIGVLTGIRNNEASPFSEADLKLLSIFGHDAIMAIEKEIFHYNRQGEEESDESRF